MEDDIGRAIRILNELLEADPEAINRIIGYRIDANAKLVAHPTAQCGARGDDGHATIGPLGIINALQWPREDGSGPIAIEVDSDGRISSFVRRA